MAERRPGLRDQQHAFVACLRGAGHAPPAGMAAARLAMLRQMVFNDFSELIGGCFPRCAGLLGRRRWMALMQRYHAGHRCRTPLFTEVAAEFVHWLRRLEALPHPALGELAHLEWAVVAVHQLDAAPLPPTDGQSPLQVPLRRSPLAWPQVYRWPVDDVARLTPATAPPATATALLIQRDDAGQVRVSPLGAWAASLFIDIGQHPGLHGRHYLHRLADHCGEAVDALSAPVTTLLQQAMVQRVIGVAADAAATPPPGTAPT